MPPAWSARLVRQAGAAAGAWSEGTAADGGGILPDSAVVLSAGIRAY